jgi:hypothetical protein
MGGVLAGEACAFLDLTIALCTAEADQTCRRAPPDTDLPRLWLDRDSTRIRVDTENTSTGLWCTNSH